MKATKRHVLINSLQRSGGTLVARLLDGHPAVHSMPFELLYAPQKVRFPTDPELAGLWRDWEGFKETMLFSRNYERIAARRFFSKDEYSKNPVDFDYRAFESRARTWFGAGREESTYAAALSACFDAFFETWLGSAPLPSGALHVNHLSMMCYASPERYFSLFPEGQIIQSLRDPYSWYASVKGHFDIAEMDRVYMTYALEVWVEATLRGLAAARFWPGRYSVVRYSDLVRNCEASMRRLAAFLGLEFDPILLRPTMGGREWLGNSSFGPKAGVDEAALETWRSRLTAEEISFVAEHSGAVGRLLAEDAVWDPDNLPESLCHPTSGVDERLTAASLEALLADESRRMSLLTFRVFTRTLQRAHAARYNKKSQSILRRALRVLGR